LPATPIGISCRAPRSRDRRRRRQAKTASQPSPAPATLFGARAEFEKPVWASDSSGGDRSFLGAKPPPALTSMFGHTVAMNAPINCPAMRTG
jgi:hypothetical protein